MNGQSSLELVMEMKKEEKNNNSRFYPSLVHAYWMVFINDLGLKQKDILPKTMVVYNTLKT